MADAAPGMKMEEPEKDASILKSHEAVWEAKSVCLKPREMQNKSDLHQVNKEAEPNRRQLAILDLLEDVVGPGVRNYVDFSQRDWSREPYNGGCFLKSLMPGTTKYFNTVLREPVDRLHFAGTETATVWCGFMNGAIQSGFRAATEVLYHVRPHVITCPDPPPDCGLNPEDPAIPQEPNSSLKYVGYIAFGAGLASLAFFLLTSDKVPKSGLAKTVRLVFDQLKSD